MIIKIIFGLFFISLLGTWIIIGIEDYKYAEHSINLCHEKGYEGVVDKGNFLNTEWHCYKNNDGFMNISEAILRT